MADAGRLDAVPLDLHQLRHSSPSLLLQPGASLVYVKDQLGHASVRLTVDTYGHLIPGANRQAVDRLDDAPGEGRPSGVSASLSATPAQPDSRRPVGAPVESRA